MARTCGIRLGRTDFDLLILDGSVKKPTVVACVSGEIPADSEDPAGDLAAALKAATKGLKIPNDAVRVVGESGIAAYRTLTLPFDDPSKIEQVIKFEVESKVPQWDIDETVVDFHVANSTGVESQLLCTVAPKAAIAEWIEVATKAGLEPYEVELDTAALINAAQKADLLTVDGSQLLVHVGSQSTALVVVDGGRVRDIRALQIGHAHEGEEGARKRFMREIARTAASMQVANPLDGIYYAGLPFQGLHDAGVADHTVKPLDPFESDKLPTGTLPRRFVAAFGAALAQMGTTKVKASLRREELRFAGKLERLELPMAVFALLLAAFAGIYFVVLQRQMAPLQSDMTRWFESSNQFMIGDPKKLIAGYIAQPPDLLVKRVDAVETRVANGELTEYEGLKQIKGYLEAEIKDIEKRIGNDTEIRKPQSVFGAMTRVLKVMEDLGHDQIGYFSVLNMIGDYRAARGQEADHVELKFSMAFFAEGGSGSPASLVATRNFNTFRNEVEAQPWCLSFPEVKTQTLDGGNGIYIESFTVEVDMTVAEGNEGGES